MATAITIYINIAMIANSMAVKIMLIMFIVS